MQLKFLLPMLAATFPVFPVWFAAAQPAPGPAGTNDTPPWYDIRQFGVEGRGWNDTKDFYDRLPARAEAIVRKPVWDLSRNSAGMCVRFVTDATTLRARWALTESWLYLAHSADQ